MDKLYDPKTIEPKWQDAWERWNIHKYDDADRVRPPFSIDTPPPYPSGELHIGNILNWCYFDFVARYKRLKGFNVHFPQGWDCHGLPTEVRTEKTLKIRKRDVPPEQFRADCIRLTNEWIVAMKQTIQKMGFSIDWNLEYRTMDPSYWRKTQLSFLRLYHKNLLYRGEHPVNWCPRCETAIAEAEVEYVQRKGNLLYLKFSVDGSDLIVATTRPELIPACVAIVVHPDDERTSNLIGKVAKTPIFKAEVPIISDEAVEKEFGSGVVMICTYGDKNDVKWQKGHDLPVIKCITENGIMTESAGAYQGLKIQAARDKIIEDLRSGNLVEREEILERSVGTCWRCVTPVEILAKPQWFMKTRDLSQRVRESAELIRWIPAYAKQRLLDWVGTLDWDWVISRQRIFATPIPVWYCKSCGEVVLAEEEWTPIDPKLEGPRGKQCPKCSSADFIPEVDVLDTWMDSSITSAVHAGWPDDDESFSRLFPADLQPNGYDIIRTWDYYLLVRSLALFDSIPYKSVLVNGMVRGKDGRMMHKSYGNYVAADEVMEKHGSDAVRQWAAAGASTGSDIQFRWDAVDYAWRFQVKLWNASKLVSSHISDSKTDLKPVSMNVLDKWLLSKVEKLTKDVEDAFENNHFSVALEAIREFFWHVFCDNYLEACKYRLYDEGGAGKDSAKYALSTSLLRILQLLSPIIPHLTEELYQIIFRARTNYESINNIPWPEYDVNLVDSRSELIGDIALATIAEIRRTKAAKKIPLSEKIEKLELYSKTHASDLKESLDDIRGTCKIENLEIVEMETNDGISVEGQDIKIVGF